MDSELYVPFTPPQHNRLKCGSGALPHFREPAFERADGCTFTGQRRAPLTARQRAARRAHRHIAAQSRRANRQQR